MAPNCIQLYSYHCTQLIKQSGEDKNLGYTQLSRRLSKDNAYLELKQKIIHGEIGPGEVVTEEGLSDLLGMSRTPLREAIQRLEIEDFLIRQKNGRLNVACLSKKEAKEIFLVRSMLEGMVVRYATRNATEKDIEELTKIVEKIRISLEENNGKDIVNVGSKFHECLYKMSELVVPVSILNKLNDHSLRYRLLISKFTNRNHSMAEHVLILDCIRRRDEEAAEKAMNDHILTSLTFVINDLDYINKIKETDKKC